MIASTVQPPEIKPPKSIARRRAIYTAPRSLKETFATIKHKVILCHYGQLNFLK